MRVRLCTVAFLVFVLGAIVVPNVVGQEPPPQPPSAPEPAAAPQPPEQPQQPAPPRARTVRPPRPEEPPRVPSEPSKGVNVRVEATVSEWRGTEVIAKKVLSVTVLDGENGAVRSTISIPIQQKGSTAFNYNSAPLNMDARVRMLDDNRVRVGLVLDYKGRLESEGQDGTEPIDQGIRQAVTVVLENGKPMVVAQSADAIGDRRVTLEVKATVLK
jgi:hypothetical protein